MIRIGKKSKDKLKEKEMDSRSMSICKEGVTRIVCTTKDSSDSLTGECVRVCEREHVCVCVCERERV